MTINPTPMDEIEIKRLIQMCGKIHLMEFIELCANLTVLWHTTFEEDTELEKEFDYPLHSLRFLRTAWILSEISEKYSTMFRKIRQNFPLLHQRLQDRLPDANRFAANESSGDGLVRDGS